MRKIFVYMYGGATATPRLVRREPREVARHINMHHKDSTYMQHKDSIDMQHKDSTYMYAGATATQRLVRRESAVREPRGLRV